MEMSPNVLSPAVMARVCSKCLRSMRKAWSREASLDAGALRFEVCESTSLYVSCTGTCLNLLTRAGVGCMYRPGWQVKIDNFVPAVPLKTRA
jgi:hypothetical protein